MVRLKDIAQELGLSVTTISRALNGFDDVSAETRKRVSTTAQRLGYRANPNARSLVTGKNGAVGLAAFASGEVIHQLHFSELVTGLMDVLAAADVDLLLIPFRANPQQAPYPEPCLTMVEGRRIDALIMTGVFANDPRVAAMESRNEPLVTHGRTEGPAHCAFVDVDNEDIGYRSTLHLLEAGHQRIGLLNGPANMAFARERERGYRRAFAEWNLRVDERLLAGGFMSDTQGYEETRRFLRTPGSVTGVIAGAMTNAIGAYRAIRAHDLRPGKDVAVTGHDDVFPHLKPENMDPSLTTTTSSMRHAGVMLARAALKLVDGAAPESLQTMLPLTWKERQSVSWGPFGASEAPTAAPRSRPPGKNQPNLADLPPTKGPPSDAQRKTRRALRFGER